jgi:phage shock protein C
VREFYRSRRNRWIAGVCGGLGEYFEIDPDLVRFLVVVVGLFTGLFPLVLTYLLAWLIFPERPR